MSNHTSLVILITIWGIASVLQTERIVAEIEVSREITCQMSQ